MNREDLDPMLERFMECSGPMAYDVEIDVVGFWNGVIDALITVSRDRKESLNERLIIVDGDMNVVDDMSDVVAGWLEDQKIKGE